MYHIKSLATKDGSYTLFNTNFNQTYHSIYGAMSESMHVFIRNGLMYMAEKCGSITLLEVGLGTGLNALLTYKMAVEKNIQVHYTAIEPFPIDTDTARLLYVSKSSDENDLSNNFLKMHYSHSGELISLHKNFSFQKYITTLENFTSPLLFDLIYYDAFSPGAQPEMWAVDAFEKIRSCMCKDATLVTYCAKGSVKRILKALNFTIESLPGANGKREMIRAIKKAAPEDAA